MSNQTKVISDEAITLEDKATNKTYTFHVGQQDDGTWLAFTNNPVVHALHFCIECDDHEDAVTVGTLATRFHIMNPRGKEVKVRK